MWRRVVLWLTPLVLSAGLVLQASGQNPPAAKDPTAEAKSKDDSASPKDHVPLPEFALTFVGTVVVLLIVCSPSRKR
jgi:hypothetical protein